MRLKVVLPTRVLLDQEIRRLVAEAPNGCFGLLPRHIDFVTALVPGLLVYEDAQGTERYLGIDAGVLVKLRDEVLVSVRDAVRGDRLEDLRARVREAFIDMDEHERAARSALARLEIGLVRRMMELREHAP